MSDDQIKFFCEHCGQKIAVARGLAGAAVRCPGCGQAANVPSDRAKTAMVDTSQVSPFGGAGPFKGGPFGGAPEAPAPEAPPPAAAPPAPPPPAAAPTYTPPPTPPPVNPYAPQPTYAPPAPSYPQQPPTYAQPYQPQGQLQPQGMQPGFPPGYGIPQPAPANGLAVASLVLGLISAVICCAGPVTGIPAIVTGVMALQKDQSRGMAITGLVAGGLGLVGGLIYWIAALSGNLK